MKLSRIVVVATVGLFIVLLGVGAVATPAAGPSQRPRPAAGAQRDPIGVALATPAGVAPQAEVDAALYVVQPFFDVSTRIPRPYADARPRVEALATRYPNDPQIARTLARLDERLGRFDEAVTSMERFASLSGRKPLALRRLAAFYRDRNRPADEIKVLSELAEKLPMLERAPVYARAIVAANDGRPAGVNVDTFYEKLIDANPENGEALREYVTLLLDSKDTERALRAVDRVAKSPGERTRATARLLLAERARIYDRLGDRASALTVYERSYDPLWPRAVAADYYALLTRYGLYRERRRALQNDAVKPGASVNSVARLFNFYAYEGSLSAGARLLESVEAGRGTVEWSSADLELFANLYAQIGDYDNASRYVYSLYLQGAMQPGAPDRERILSRLFETLVEASSSATRIAPGGISLYADIARIDRRPGAVNALLSLILAGNNPAAEYRLEEAKAGGYLNRALAHSIYERFSTEFPASPRLGLMTVELLEAYADLGANSDAVAVGTAFLNARPDAPDYEFVALAVADAHVRLKNRTAERAVLATLLDRGASRSRGRALIERSPARMIPMFGAVAFSDDESWSVDEPPALFMAPNGVPVDASQAGRFDDEGSEESSDPGSFGDAVTDPDDYRSEPDDYRGQPDAERRRPSYGLLLERTVASFEAENRKSEALAFFWSELRKHPNDEGLHERFLGWLGNTSLINEELKAYKLALERYDDGTWLHRVARWYVRRGRGAEIRRLTDQVIRTLDDEQVTTYLQEYAGYGGASRGDSLDVDKALALQMTRIAMQRFPNNERIARMLLDRLADAKAWPEWERLSREHYFGNESIRTDYLKRLSETGRLEADYVLANERARGGLEADSTSSFAYAVFTADAARWLSRFDESIAAYRRLVALYPGEPAYAMPLSDLLRSFGSRDPKFYDESAEVLDGMSRIHPTDASYATKAGEALAEAGRMPEAAKRWRSIVAASPGSPKSRLDVATIFWDYYQFTDAAAELEALRLSTRDDTLYAFRLGAIHDSKRDLAKAIPEYVKTLGTSGGEREQAMVRLAELQRRPGVSAQIASAYAAVHASRPTDGQLVLGYVDYLKRIENSGEAVGVLNRAVDQLTDPVFLDEARGRFRAWRSPDGEIRTLQRLADNARDERERIRARLQLASVYESEKRRDDAAGVVDRLVSEYSTNFGVIDEAVRIYWRLGLMDRSVALSRDVIARSAGDYRKRFVIDLSRRQTEAGRLSDAEATLRAYFTESPLDMDVFGALAKTIGDQKKDEVLAALYVEGLKRIREAGLGDDEENLKVAELRTGTIAALSRLGRHTEAIDQHIEIINRDPEGYAARETAFEYAARHDQSARLVGYYEKLAKESYKDYRWSLVLGHFYELNGNTGGAIEAYQRAVVNEPQRVDFRRMLASAMVRGGRFDDAVVELRRGWEIDGKDPSWLLQVAEIRVQQGRLDDAAATLEEAIAGRKSITPGELCGYAERLDRWGLLEKSVALYDRAIEAAKTRPEQSGLSVDRLSAYVRVASRVRAPADLFNRLEALRSTFAGRGDPSSFYSGKDIARAIEEVERTAFPRAVADYGSASERSALDAALRTAASRATETDARRRYLGIAQLCGLSESHEAILVSIVEQALSTSSVDQGVAFRNAVTELAESLASRAQFARAANQLSNFRARDPKSGDFDYDRRIAEYYRLAGDTPNEIAALERLYTTAGGSVMTGGERTVAVERLFEVLVATGQRDRLVALAGRQSPFQLILINHLIRTGDQETAARAIASSGFSPVWAKAKTAEMGLYFRNASPAVETAFREALDVKPIGERVGRPFNSDTMLTGGDYFLVARNYGLWLDVVASRGNEARNFIVGRLEQRPRDAAPQEQLARYYLVRDELTQAGVHAELAGEIAPRQPSVIGIRGEVLAATGKVSEAVALWTQLIEADDAGSESYDLYFRLMSSHGKLDVAVTRLRDVIAARMYVGQFGEVRAVIGSMADYGREHPQQWPAIADMFYGAAVGSVDDIELLQLVLNEDLVGPERRGPFYRLITDRLDSLAIAAANDDEDAYVYIGGEAVTPSDELRKWQRRAVDYFITRGDYAEAEALLKTVESATIESHGRLYDQASSTDETWIELARATIALKQGDKVRGLAALGRFIDADVDEDGEPGTGEMSRCQSAVAVLRANGAHSEAEDLLEATYRKLLEVRNYDASNFTGLAEVLYRRGRADEANGVLRRLAAGRNPSTTALSAAADAASRSAQYPVAMELRQLVLRHAPADIENRLELARLLAATGNGRDALSALLEIVADERASNRVRAQAVDLAVEVATADASARTAGSAKVASGRTEPERVLAARLLAVAGDVDGARRGLEAVLAAGASPFAAIELGRLELAANRPGEAARAFELSLAAESNGNLGSSISFGGATPVHGLIRAYVAMGRLDAALKLAESRAGTYQLDGEEEAAGLVFEPEVVEARIATGLPSLGARNVEAEQLERIATLSSLIDAASRSERWSDAVAFGRQQASLLPPETPEREQAQRRIGDLLSLERDAERRAYGILRIGEAVAAESITIRDFTLD